MKNTMRKLLALSMTMAIMLTGTTNVGAAEEYQIQVNNATTTGFSIEGDEFQAYQVLSAGTTTSYVINDAFKNFFQDKIAGLAIITDTDEYNQTVAKHLDGLSNDELYDLAVAMRKAILGKESTITATPRAAEAEEANVDGNEIATITGLDKGWYFVTSPDSDKTGLSAAGTGAFVALPEKNFDNKTVVSKIKQSQPTIEKEIETDGDWDIVGDSQIGDIVDFRVKSTLPTKEFVDKFVVENNRYNYTIADVMTAGLKSNDDVIVYTDETCETKLDEKYWSVDYSEPTKVEGKDVTADFVVTVNVKLMYDNNLKLEHIYTKYSAVLTDAAIIATGADMNKVELKYSNNPYDAQDFGYGNDDVKHYTFEMDVTKVDEEGEALADAVFGLFIGDKQLKLSKVTTVGEDGIVKYYVDENATFPTLDNGEEQVKGYIVTEIHDAVLDDGTKAQISRFQIIGLDDNVEYTLKEVQAPKGYNAVEDLPVKFAAEYDKETGNLIDLGLNQGTKFSRINSDTSANSGAQATIMNRMEVYLPSTGGMGTVLFPVIGGGLMLGAAAVLLISKRKNAVK